MTDTRKIPKGKPLKLDELKRDNVFRAPDGYFDGLPAQIQARINKRQAHRISPVLVTSLKFALPVVVLAIVVFQLDLFAPESADQDPLALIDEVSTEDLITYLGKTDITADEILEEIDLNSMDIDFSDQGAVLFNDFELENDEINQILEEYDIEGDYL